jgi:hypothetical protein
VEELVETLVEIQVQPHSLLRDRGGWELRGSNRAASITALLRPSSTVDPVAAVEQEALLQPQVVVAVQVVAMFGLLPRSSSTTDASLPTVVKVDQVAVQAVQLAAVAVVEAVTSVLAQPARHTAPFRLLVV